MNARDVLKTALTSTQKLLNWYISDLSDADLHIRPVPTANNIAWQLGHMIHSEAFLLHDLPGARYPELPAHFREQYHGKNGRQAPGTELTPVVAEHDQGDEMNRYEQQQVDVDQNRQHHENRVQQPPGPPSDRSALSPHRAG